MRDPETTVTSAVRFRRLCQSVLVALSPGPENMLDRFHYLRLLSSPRIVLKLAIEGLKVTLQRGGDSYDDDNGQERESGENPDR
jgi:hypothetical protein